jgi:hypothetical protein
MEKLLEVLKEYKTLTILHFERNFLGEKMEEELRGGVRDDLKIIFT